MRTGVRNENGRPFGGANVHGAPCRGPRGSAAFLFPIDDHALRHVATARSAALRRPTRLAAFIGIRSTMRPPPQCRARASEGAGAEVAGGKRPGVVSRYQTRRRKIGRARRRAANAICAARCDRAMFSSGPMNRLFDGMRSTRNANSSCASRMRSTSPEASASRYYSRTAVR
jgi:hypothetical protein